MDTNRIRIFNKDQSFDAGSFTSAILGFTVLKAEKGPIEPVLVPSSSPQRIKALFGDISKDFTDVQELLDFNAYSAYVSAPYNVASTTIPVAYMSPAGIFARSASVPLTNRLEDILGEEAEIEHINTFASTSEDVLIPVGVNSLFVENAADVNNPLSFVANKVQINLGTALDMDPSTGEPSQPTETSFLFLNTKAFDASTGHCIRQAKSAVVGVLVLDIEGAATRLELDVVIDNGDLLLRVEGKSVGTLSTTDSSIFELVGNTGLTNDNATWLDSTVILSKWPALLAKGQVKVYWKAAMDTESIAATFYPKYPSARTIRLSFANSEDKVYGNKLNISVAETVKPGDVITSTLGDVSILTEGTNGFGQNIFIGKANDQQDLIAAVVINPFTDQTVYPLTKSVNEPAFINPSIILSRGVRNTEDIYELGWTEAADPDMDVVDVFFSTKPVMAGVDAEFTTDSTFFKLANTHKVSRFIFNKTVAPSDVATVTQLGFGRTYININNIFARERLGIKFTSPLTGAYALMIAACLDPVYQKYGGVAPMYTNVEGLGGQLAVAVRKALYKYDKDQLDILDKANYNTIMNDRVYGIIVRSQKTCQAGPASDWAYVGHMSAFLSFQREVRDQVMIPQLGKPINPEYISRRAQQVQSLIDRRTTGTNRIWAAATVDTTNINNTDALLARTFRIAVVVKVDIFSEGVELYFTNVDQTTDLA